MEKKNGKEIKYYDGKLHFQGEYLNDKEWDGKGYDLNNNVVYELKQGKGYDMLKSIIVMGNYILKVNI